MAPARAHRDFPGSGVRETVFPLGPDAGDAAGDAVAQATETAGEWRITWTFARGEAGTVVRAMELAPTGQPTPAGGISSALLREISPSHAAAEAAEGLRDAAPPGTFAEMLLQWRAQDAPPASSDRVDDVGGRRPGRPRLSEQLLREVALAYLAEQHKRGVLDRLAARFDRPRETVRDWVHAARREGWLTKGVPGVRGASPGPRLGDEETP